MPHLYVSMTTRMWLNRASTGRTRPPKRSEFRMRGHATTGNSSPTRWEAGRTRSSGLFSARGKHTPQRSVPNARIRGQVAIDARDVRRPQGGCRGQKTTRKENKSIFAKPRSGVGRRLILTHCPHDTRNAALEYRRRATRDPIRNSELTEPRCPGPMLSRFAPAADVEIGNTPKCCDDEERSSAASESVGSAAASPWWLQSRSPSSSWCSCFSAYSGPTVCMHRMCPPNWVAPRRRGSTRGSPNLFTYSVVAEYDHDPLSFTTGARSPSPPSADSIVE